jgi:hypothetical protein
MAVIAISIGWIRVASADCSAGPTYDIDMQGHSVVVCINQIFEMDAGACPDGYVMLREDTKTGKVVTFGSLCTQTEWGDACFWDECAPRGTYRYGFETPFECEEASCWPTPFYGEFTVSSDPGDCSFSEGNPGPVAYVKPTPWADSGDGLVCGASDEDAGACSVASTGSRTVLSVNAIAFLLGLLLLARRKRP